MKFWPVIYICLAKKMCAKQVFVLSSLMKLAPVVAFNFTVFSQEHEFCMLMFLLHCQTLSYAAICSPFGAGFTDLLSKFFFSQK